MNLFARKMPLFCVSNIMLSFVCTGFLGAKTTGGIINGSTTDEAHEISLTASDTEPVSHFGEGEEYSLAFITKSVEAVINQQEDTVLKEEDMVQSEFAFITNSVRAVIDQQEKALGDKKEEKKVEKKASTKKTTTKKTTTTTTKSSYTKPSYSSVTGDAIVSFAKQFMGLRYKSGTPSLTSGADCSGFTMLIYREFGVSLPRTVGGQISKGKYVAKKDLQKGDLVFYKAKGSKGGASHVGIYYGGGQVIHESRPGVGVKLSTVNMMQYVTARRVINSNSVKIAEQKLEEEKKKNEVITDTTSNTGNNTVDTTTNNNDNNVNNNVVSATPTPSATPSVTPTPSETPSVTPTPAPTIEEPKAQATPEAKVEVTNESTSTEESN